LPVGPASSISSKAVARSGSIRCLSPPVHNRYNHMTSDTTMGMHIFIGTRILIFAIAVSPDPHIQWPPSHWFTLGRLRKRTGDSGAGRPFL
jgi:hypothetical protein